MKKLTAILFLLVFLFNTGGYRLWFYFSEKQADQRLQASLDRNEYNDEELITLRVPLSLPYQHDTKDFERVSGEVTFKGKIYTYVKRKVENGECVLLCLPDKMKMKLESVKEGFVTSDIVQNNSKRSGNSKSISLKNSLSDYDQYSSHFDLNTFNTFRKIYSLYKEADLVSFPHISPEQPPEYTSSCIS